MKEYALLMTFFGIVTLIYGFIIYAKEDPPLPARYHGSRTRTYLKYFGKTVMLVSVAPLLSAGVALFGDSAIVVILSIATLIGGFIILLLISIYCMHPDRKK